MFKTVVGASAAVAAGLAGANAAAQTAQTAIPPAPADFAMAAAQSAQYEIEAAQLALAQSHDASVRAFAEQMIQDHTRGREAIGQAAQASGLPRPPPAMSSDQASMLGALQSLRGADFDKAYARQQVLAHSQALAVEQSFAASGADPNLRKVAQTDVPMIQAHLDRANRLVATLGTS